MLEPVQLDPEAREAIRGFFWKQLAPLAGALGFVVVGLVSFIWNSLREVDAYKAANTAAQAARDGVREDLEALVSGLTSSITKSLEEVSKAKADAVRIGAELGEIKDESTSARHDAREAASQADGARMSAEKSLEKAQEVVAQTSTTLRIANDAQRDAEGLLKSAEGYAEELRKWREALSKSLGNNDEIQSLIRSITQLISSSEKLQSLVPAGTIAAFAGNGRVPDGWLLCDGREFTDKEIISRSGVSFPGEFSKLREAISDSWGGTKEKPRLPRLQGMFLRGAGGFGQPVTADHGPRYVLDQSGAKIDVNNAFAAGTLQDDMVGPRLQRNDDGKIEELAKPLGHLLGNRDRMLKYVREGQDVLCVTDMRPGPETRPKNAAVYWIIKY